MQEMITLGFLFDHNELFANIRKSGGFDGIDLGLVVSRNLKSPGVWSGILNLCARLCFETLSFDAPLIFQKGQTLEKKAHLFVDLHGPGNGERVSIEKTDTNQVCIRSASTQALGMVLNCLAISSLHRPMDADSGPDKSGIKALNPGDRLTGLYTPQGILTGCQINGRDMEDIFLNPAINGGKVKKVSPPVFHALDFDSLYKKEKIASTRQQLTMAWSLQCPSLSFDTGLALFDAISAMVMESTAIRLPLVFDHHDSPGSDMATGQGSDLLFFVVNETEPREGSQTQSLTLGFPDPLGPVFISGNAQGFSDHLFSWVELALKQGGPGFSRAQAIRDQAADFSAVAHEKWKMDAIHENLVPLTHEFAIGSEIEALIKAVSSLDKGQGDIFCETWVSKPRDIRTRLRNEIEAILMSKGYCPKVLVLNAFKPGLCRILDLDLPDLLGKKPARVHISYCPFTSRSNALELKHRWLHELFPVVEILAKKLGIPEKEITLSMETDQEETYELTAFDIHGNILFQDRFSPFFHTFDYMASCPDQGTVSPTCSGIKVMGSDQVFLKQAIPTDRDRFWKKFQNEFIPDLIKSMGTLFQPEYPETRQSFFESIQVDVFIDESNFRLGFMDEQISPMEKLHEDIYFFLLKVFEQFALEHRLPESVKLGQILPRVHSETGRKGAWAGIRALPARDNPTIFSQARPSVHSAMTFDTLVMDKNGWTLSGKRIESNEKPITDPDQALANDQSSGYDSKKDKNRFSLALDLFPLDSELANPGGISGPIPDDILLSAEVVKGHLSWLNELTGIRVWEIAKSLQKRPIYAVEAFRVQGSRVSIPRLRMAKPTVVFNARHHANEVSSTNAVLKFIEFLGSVQGRSCLETANAVFIPLENVDGVATFEYLYIKDSCDILHAARYNALGAEFYGEYFKHPPAFSEAYAKQRLWRQWLPELMADLHGVPGHEWCQPYAGYLPKGFREFWIPRAFVYIHLPFIEDKEHPLYKQAMELAKTMRKAIAEEKKIVTANKRITALYEKYARRPEPDVFPEADNTELTALPLLGRARNFNFAVQYPDITRAEMIVEVPDEVAHGENLALCVAAHYKIQEALIRALTPRDVHMISLPDSESGYYEFEFSVSQAQNKGLGQIERQSSP